jgi:exonuclease SbcD
MKFIHTADIHLDSPLLGLERYEGAPVEAMHGATRRALENLVDLALRETVDFVLIAGDVYDGDWRDFNTGLFFARQMGRLREAGVPVFLIAGNHDAAGQITRRLRLPENVHAFPADRPRTVQLNDLGAAIHGRSFASRAVTENLAAGYPPAVPGAFNIGLLHTSVTGREGHETYAPCSVDDLRRRGYDYWALGHVHTREVVSEAPWIVFPGNVQGRHVRETGAKGCTLVTVDDGRIVAAEHCPLDVLRWVVVTVDLSAARTADEAVDLARSALAAEEAQTDGRPLAARLRLTGASPAHRELAAEVERWRNELRAAATDASAGRVWIEKVECRTRAAADLDGLARRSDALGELWRSVRDLQPDDALRAALAEDLADLRRKAPPELKSGPDALDLDAPDLLRDAVADVRELLLARLARAEDRP